MTQASATQQPDSLSVARIDWGKGRIIGYSTPADDRAFDVVQVLVNDHCILRATANQSVFNLARDLAGMTLPSRENTAFDIKIPQACLLPDHLQADTVRLELRTSQDTPFYAYTFQSNHELLRLLDGVPADLLFEVSFKGIANGAVMGVVADRVGSGIAPRLLAQLNEHPTEELPLFERSTDGRKHFFSIPIRTDRLQTGRNVLRVLSPTGEPLAAYPIQLGSEAIGESDRRIAALEAEVAFLKQLSLTQPADTLPARMAIMKSEIINICSDMLALQRTTLEAEWRGSRNATGAAASKSGSSR